MKVFKIEIRFFCGAFLDFRNLKVTAVSMEQLEQGVIEGLTYMSDWDNRTPVQVWEQNKKFAIEEELTFPIIEEIK